MPKSKIIVFLDELIVETSLDPNNPRDKVYKHFLSGQEVPFWQSNIEAKINIRNKVESWIEETFGKDELRKRKSYDHVHYSLEKLIHNLIGVEGFIPSDHFFKTEDGSTYIDNTYTFDDLEDFNYIKSDNSGDFITYDEDNNENITRYNTPNELYDLEVQATQNNLDSHVEPDWHKTPFVQTEIREFDDVRSGDYVYVFSEDPGSTWLEKLSVLGHSDDELVFRSIAPSYLNADTSSWNKMEYANLAIPEKVFLEKTLKNLDKCITDADNTIYRSVNQSNIIKKKLNIK